MLRCPRLLLLALLVPASQIRGDEVVWGLGGHTGNLHGFPNQEWGARRPHETKALGSIRSSQAHQPGHAAPAAEHLSLRA